VTKYQLLTSNEDSFKEKTKIKNFRQRYGFILNSWQGYGLSKKTGILPLFKGCREGLDPASRLFQ
jgi:hypothetical protein